MTSAPDLQTRMQRAARRHALAILVFIGLAAVSRGALDSVPKEVGLGGGSVEDSLWQEEDPVASEDEEGDFTQYVIASLAVSAAMLCGGMLLMRWLAGRRRELTGLVRPRERLSEKQFEYQVLADLGVRPLADASVRIVGDGHTPRSTAGASASGGTVGVMAGPPKPSAEGGTRVGDAPTSVRAAIERLRTAGLLDESEPALPPSPDLAAARLVLLRSGMRVAVFSADAPVEGVFRVHKMVDYVILSRDDGSALICRPMSDFLAEAVFPAGGPAG